MYYLIYKTTNLINGKFYIGAHKTENIGDSYMGSGKYLKQAIKKNGIESFSREILHILESVEEMYKKEAELVTEEFICNENTYNLKPGGSGGNPGIIGAFAGRKHSEESKEKIKLARAKQAPMSEDARRRISEKSFAKTPEGRQYMSQILTGRICSDEHRLNVAKANLGKILVNNGTICKRIDKKEESVYLSDGWVRGMIKNTSLV